MLTYEVVEAKGLRIGTACKVTTVRARIEELIKQFDLSVFQVTTLSGLPSSVRYRMRLEPAEDVLEILYWPVRHRLWVCVCANSAPVVRDLALPLAQAAAQVFGGRAELVVRPVVWDESAELSVSASM